MSYSHGSKSPPRNDGRASPLKSILVTKVPARSYSKNDLLMASPIAIHKGTRSNPNSPKAQSVPAVSEQQKVFLQSLNGQINHLESEFNHLLAVKESVDNAKVHTGEEYNEEKAMLLEKKEMEYLQLRKDRSSALINLASEIKMLIEASPNHTAPHPRTPVRQGTNLDFNHDSFPSSQNTPLKLSELGALASSNDDVHSRTVERILFKQSLTVEDLVPSHPAIIAPASAVPTSTASSAAPTFVAFPPQVYKPLDNKYLTAGGGSGTDSPQPSSLFIPSATEVASPATSDDDSKTTVPPAAAPMVAPAMSSVAPATRLIPVSVGGSVPFSANESLNHRPLSSGSLVNSDAANGSRPAPQAIYAANPVPLHATRSSNNLSHSGIHSAPAAATAAFSSSFGGGSQPAAPIFHASSGPGGGGGNITSLHQPQGFTAAPAAPLSYGGNNYPSSSGAGGPRNQPSYGGGRPQPQAHPYHHMQQQQQYYSLYQDHIYSSPPPPPPPPQQPVVPSPEPEEPPRFSNEEITQMLDHSNATTQQYLTLLQTQMKSLEIKHQTSENALLLRLAAVESRLEALESHHQNTVAAHQETLSRMVPVEEFQALRASVETLAEAFVKVQKQVSASQAQATVNIHKSLGMRIMNGISNSLASDGNSVASAAVAPVMSFDTSANNFPGAVVGAPTEEHNSVAPVQELGYRLEQLEQTLIQERDNANRAMHDMMIQNQQQNRLEALEHRKEILELMKSHRNNHGSDYPQYVGSGGSSPAAKSVHSAPATVGHTAAGHSGNNGHRAGGYHTEVTSLRERRKDLLHQQTVTPIKPLHVDASEIHELDIPFSSSSGGGNGFNPQVPHYSDDPSRVNPDLFHHQIVNPDTIRLRPNAAGYLRSIKAIPPLPSLPLLPSESNTPPVAGASTNHSDVNDAMYYFNHVTAAAVAAASNNSRSTSPALTSSSSHARTSRSTTPTNLGGRRGAGGGSAGGLEDEFRPVMPEYQYETLLQSNSRLFPTFPQGIAAATTPTGATAVKHQQQQSKKEESRSQPAPQQSLQPHNIKATAPFMQPTSSHQIKLWSKK